MNAKKFFDDNVKRINVQTDPIMWNTQHGLAALAEQLAGIERRQADQDSRLRRIESIVQQARLR